MSATNLIDLYSVKYVISVTSLEEDSRFELVDSGMGGAPAGKEDFSEYTVKLYRHKNPLPRAWLVKDLRVMDSKTILSAITRKDFYPQKEVLFDEENGEIPSPGGPSYATGPMSSDRVEFISESNNRVRLQVTTAEKAMLVLSDTYFPGWKARVNDKEQKIYRVNYTFRGLSLGPGTHSIEFIYDPLSVKLGAWITFVGILGCLLIVRINRKRKNRPSD